MNTAIRFLGLFISRLNDKFIKYKKLLKNSILNGFSQLFHSPNNEPNQ